MDSGLSHLVGAQIALHSLPQTYVSAQESGGPQGSLKKGLVSECLAGEGYRNGYHKLFFVCVSGKEKSFETSTLTGIRVSGNSEGHFPASVKSGYKRDDARVETRVACWFGYG